MIKVIAIETLIHDYQLFANITYYDDENILNPELYYVRQYGPLLQNNKTLQNIQECKGKFIKYLKKMNVHKNDIEKELDFINSIKVEPKPKVRQTRTERVAKIAKDTQEYYSKMASNYLHAIGKNGYKPLRASNPIELYNVALCILIINGKPTNELENLCKPLLNNKDDKIYNEIKDYMQTYLKKYVRKYRQAQRDIIRLNESVLEINDDSPTKPTEYTPKHPEIKGNGNYRYSKVSGCSNVNKRIPLTKRA